MPEPNFTQLIQKQQDCFLTGETKNIHFGGTGNSGMDKYHGKYSFEAFSNIKPEVYKATWLDIPIRYAPFKNKIY